jgi:hypothetical protein
MSTFNPGRLQNISRNVNPQPIIPGGARYDYVSSVGDRGRRMPAVGRYPSGGPSMGLAGELADGPAPATVNWGGLAIMGVGVYLIWKGWLRDALRRAR